MRRISVITLALTLGAAMGVIATAGPAGAAATTSWTGATAIGTNASNWSQTSNWSPGVPSGSTGLSFPVLTSSQCTATPPMDSCYTSNNDITGLTPDYINLANPTFTGTSSFPGGYNFTGNAITLGGAGGTALTTTETPPSGATGTYFAQSPVFDLPVVLGANQTWDITGSGPTIDAGVTGSSATLNINLNGLTNGDQSVTGSTVIESNVEAGNVTVSSLGLGDEVFILGGPVGVTPTPGELNATDGNTVTFNNVASQMFGTVGAFRANGAFTSVGALGSTATTVNGEGEMNVAGAATFQNGGALNFVNIGSSTTAGTTYPQLSATGTVTLGQPELNLFPSCSATLSDGQVLTLIKGSFVTGQLTDGSNFGEPILDGGVVTAQNPSCPSPSPTYNFQIHYTSTAVTATVTSLQPSGTSVFMTPNPTTPGTPVTFSASVSPLSGTGTPTGSVAFTMGGAALCTATLSGGTGSCSAPAPSTVDTYPILGSYSGDSTFGSSSGFSELIVASVLPPTGVTATPGDGQVMVAWNAVGNAASYSVYDATTSGGENLGSSPACTATAPSTNCTVTGLTDGTTYYFVVVATNVTASSLPSAEVQATPLSLTPPAAPPGSVSSASGVSTTPGGTASATNAGTSVTATGEGAVTVAQYGSNPAGAPSFSSSGEYFDVKVSTGNTFTSMTINDCNLNGGTTLYWWNPSAGVSGAWVPVVGNPGPSLVPGSPPCVTVTLDSSTSPNLSQLNGTVFAVASPPLSTGYWEVASDGGLFAFNAPFYGSMGGRPLNRPVVGMAFDPATGGYWEVATDGGLFAFNAPFEGSMGGKPLNSPVVSMAYDPATGGYWEVAADGGIFAFNAPFYGSMGGKPLNSPIVGMAYDPATGGYWEVAADGGLFAFNAPFEGSMGGRPLNRPVVGMAFDPSTGGYWEVASDGGLFAFNAPFEGSMGGRPLNRPVVGMAFDPSTGGYWEVASDGGLFAFNAPFEGSMGGKPLNSPVVNMAVDI